MRPGPTADVASAAGITASRLVVRVFAVAEIAAAVVAITLGGPVAAAAVAAMYLAFAGFVVMLKMRGIKTAGCGCFGQESEDPPGSLHIVVDLVAALIAGIGAVVAVPGIATVLADQPLAGVPYIGFVALGVWLLMVMLTDLPRLAYLTMETST